MMDILPDVAKAKEFIDKGMNATQLFVGIAATSLIAAFNAGVRTTSISTTGQATNDIRYILQALNQRGYKAAIGTGSTIQVTW